MIHAILKSFFNIHNVENNDHEKLVKTDELNNDRMSIMMTLCLHLYDLNILPDLHNMYVSVTIKVNQYLHEWYTSIIMALYQHLCDGISQHLHNFCTTYRRDFCMRIIINKHCLFGPADFWYIKMFRQVIQMFVEVLRKKIQITGKIDQNMKSSQILNKIAKPSISMFKLQFD